MTEPTHEYKMGKNLLNELFTYAFDKLNCNKLVLTSYNTNISYANQYLKKYPNLKIEFYANRDKIAWGNLPENDYKTLLDEGRLKINATARTNVYRFHTKSYCFFKDDEILLTAVGSPNFTNDSNGNIECLLYSHEKSLNKSIYDKIINYDWKWHNIPIEKRFTPPDPPITILDPWPPDKFVDVDEEYLDGLWPMQKYVLREIINNLQTEYPNSMVNVPPGTGKTNIAQKFIQFFYEKYSSTEPSTIIITVPKLILLDQWQKRIKSDPNLDSYSVYVFKTTGDASAFFNSSNKKILIILDSRMWGGKKKECRDCTSITTLDECPKCKQEKETQKQKYEPNLKEKPEETVYTDIINKLHSQKIKNLLFVIDEAHNIYPKLDHFEKSLIQTRDKEIKCHLLCLSATMDTFEQNNYIRLLTLIGGSNYSNNLINISLSNFYDEWNESTPDTPALKKVDYTMIPYCIDKDLYENYMDFDLWKGIFADSSNNISRVQRSKLIKEDPEAFRTLVNYLTKHNHEIFSGEKTIIFVPTATQARTLQTELVKSYASSGEQTPSIYVYDSRPDSKKHHEYIFNHFNRSGSNIVISVFMLSEGFDVPTITTAVLFGSHKSDKDWIQKIGRALRQPREETNWSTAKIYDLVTFTPSPTCDITFTSDLDNVIDFQQDRVKTLHRLHQKFSEGNT